MKTLTTYIVAERIHRKDKYVIVVNRAIINETHEGRFVARVGILELGRTVGWYNGYSFPTFNAAYKRVKRELNNRTIETNWVYT